MSYVFVCFNETIPAWCWGWSEDMHARLPGPMLNVIIRSTGSSRRLEGQGVAQGLVKIS